jgi:protein-disulfide isomerase
MPSGKRARQQRQAAPPPVRSKGGARQASPKVLAIAGGVVVLVIVAIVLAVVLSKSSGNYSGSGDGPKIKIATGTPTIGNSSTSSLRQAVEVATLLKGIPQSGYVLGDPTAPVTLVEYIDLQCPVCGQFETTEFQPLVEKYVRHGKLKIEMQPWSILDVNPGEYDSNRGQNATIAAAELNKAFNFTQVLYENQATEHTGWLNDAMISNIAASVDGLRPYQLATDANSAATQRFVASIKSFAAAHPTQMTGTPTLYLRKGVTGSLQYYGTGLPDLTSLEAAIDALLK